MARTVIQISYNTQIDTAIKKAEQILVQNKFNKTIENNEEIWKKGTGFLTAVQFIKTEFAQDSMTISAWVKTGLGGSEMDLGGFVGAVPKKSLMKVVEQIKVSV